MATEITEEGVLSRVKEQAYFSEEEFPPVPKLLAKLVETGKLIVTETLEWALKQAEILNKYEVFVVCLSVLERARPQIFEEKFEEGKPLAIIGKLKATVVTKMLEIVAGECFPSCLTPNPYRTFKTLCGLDY